MSQMKLFGSAHGGARLAKRAAKPKKQKAKKPLKVLAIILAILLVLEGLYFYCCYGKGAFITKWRTIYINTAMDTMTHQWLATAFLPKDVIDEVREEYGNIKGATIGVETTWGNVKPAEQEVQEPVPEEPVVTEPAEPVELKPDITVEPPPPTPEELRQQAEQEAKERFFALFWEINPDSMQAYIDEHPDVLANGWDNIYINQCGWDEEGTSIRTTITSTYQPDGEQVLAIDAANGVLLVRIQGDDHRGVLAIGKDPSLLTVEMASTLGRYGQPCGQIAEEHSGILAMNASGFIDPDGSGNGSMLAGYCMSNGTAYGQHIPAWAYKRAEIRSDNLLYIVDALSAVGETCRDAVEFTPAMIIDGQKLIDYEWTGNNPRTCIGQSEKFEILMLCIEGVTRGVKGASTNECSDYLLQHGCYQAMNLDGGASTMLWFDGKYAIASSNASLRNSGGRPLPNAFVYHAKPAQTEPDAPAE